MQNFLIQQQVLEAPQNSNEYLQETFSGEISKISLFGRVFFLKSQSFKIVMSGWVGARAGGAVQG